MQGPGRWSVRRLKIFRSFNCGQPYSGEAPEKNKHQRNPKLKANQPSICVFLQRRCGSLGPRPAGCHQPRSPWRPGRMASGPRSPQFPGQLGGTAAPQSFPQASARGIRARASRRAVSGLRSRQARAPRPVGVGAKPRMSSEIPAAGSGRWQRLSSFVLEPKLPFLSPTSQGCV